MKKPPSLIDSHAHLPLLEHSHEQDIIQRAREAGVQKIITISTEETSWEPNRRLAVSNPDVYYSIGVHPHQATQWAISGSMMYQKFEPFPLIPEKCVAIGETGLDFFYDSSPRDFQVHAFESQIEFSKKTGLPVVIHCRDAFDTLYESIKRIGLGKAGGVMHCFTGNIKQAKEALDLGLKISFSGILTFPKAEELRKAAKEIPFGEMLLETDCPFLAPAPFRGKPNEPALIRHTAQCLAHVLGKSFEEIADVTTKNAIEFFQLN